MTRLSRDAVIAIVLLMFCGVMYWASLEIREPDYGVLMPSTWPRIIIVLLAFLSAIYLVQSLRQDASQDVDADPSSPSAPAGGGLGGWFQHWRNPIFCFVLFFGYLAVMPYVGMLVAGISFVFLLCTVLGGWDGKKPMLHLVIAVVAVGGMWSLFTYGLGVLLPSGELFDNF